LIGMHIAYKRLFRIQVQHGWYADGATLDDFAVVPTPSTAAILDELGLRVRAHGDGITVFAEVEPDTTPPRLRRSFGALSLRLAFELRALNPPLLNITDLPPHRPARTIFCFDNLREDIASGRLQLGDRVANARIGPAVALVTTPAYTHTLGAPGAAAAITIRDRFGATLATLDARSPDPSMSLTEVTIDLSGVPGAVPGRYEIADDRGGSARIYFDPGLAPTRPFGVVEIYSRTDGITPDATDRVPASYRFTSGDTVTGIGPYFAQFDAVATTWRYVVQKKYANNGIALGQLSIVGPIAFAGAVAGDTALFTSTTTVRLSAAPRSLKLRRQPAHDIRDLPNPGLTTPLGSAPPSTNFVSDMFVYV
jgi:hypothetical protein